MKAKFSLIIIASILFSLFLVPIGINSGESNTQVRKEHPNGWTHRPIVEHFTGLSCGPCMNGAHPDATRLWEEEGYSEGYPWNYIEFHELNGGGEDELMTDDARERMSFYQPGGSGTPDLEMDGGYVQCGGSHGSTADANYEDIKKAVYDSGERDEIKKVNIDVRAIFDGKSFVINVTIEYLENNEPFFPSLEKPLPDDTLHGTIYVFMVEDNVIAYSKSLDENVLCHNVFREYAIFDFQFEMQIDDTINKMAVWDVPTTMIRDEEEIPIKVPINPLNVYPLAVVFDLDDRSSGRGDGSENKDGDGGDGPPRALNSATPDSTKYENNDVPPEITIEEPGSRDGMAVINIIVQDDSGKLTAAYVLYREAGKNDTNWSFKEITFEEEVCEGDVCTIGSGKGYAVLDFTDDIAIEYSVVAYDGNWTKGESEIVMYEKQSSSSKDNESSAALVGGTIVVFLIIGAAAYLKIRKKKN